MPDKFDRFPLTVSADCYIAIGNRQSQLGNYPSALAAYDRAITIAPSYARAYNYRGSFRYAKLGDIQGALVDFDAAITSGRLRQRIRPRLCDRPC